MGHLHPPLQPDGHLRSGDSCWMKTGMGLGLLKGSANQPAIITDNNWASLPPPAAFDCSLSPHALRVPQVRPPGSSADEIVTRSDSKHRGEEGLFRGSKQETGGDANAD